MMPFLAEGQRAERGPYRVLYVPFRSNMTAPLACSGEAVSRKGIVSLYRYALGQIARLVDIAAPQESGIVGEELEGAAPRMGRNRSSASGMVITPSAIRAISSFGSR